MDVERVVVVRGPVGPGSGYVVAPRLAVTCAHVVGPEGSAVQLFRPGVEDLFEGVVVWRGTPGGRDDGALVAIADTGWSPPSGPPVRWGRTVTFRPGIACRTWGVPDAVQEPDRAAELLEPSGTLNPGDLLVADRYVMAVDGRAPDAPPATGSSTRSPWAGLSGGALFCGDLLTGVIAGDPDGWGHSRLTAVPAYALHHFPEFRAALAQHGALPWLEPVEWQDLTEQWRPAGGESIRSPAGLLSPHRALVPFRARRELLQELESWAAGTGSAVRLIHARGGQGKSRLAHELCLRLAAERWTVAWVSPRADAESLRGLSDSASPLLVVLDYAETRLDQLAAVLDACARHTGESPIRVLLLARTAGPWWEAARSMSKAAEDLLGSAPATTLTPWESDPAALADAYHAAVTAFAGALGQVDGEREQPWVRVADALPQPDLDVAAPTTALGLYLRALADLLDAAHPAAAEAAPAQEGALEDRVLRHEYRYWEDAARARGLRPTPLSWETLQGSMAAAFLVGADDADGADTLLARLPGLADQPYDRRRQTRAWITDLYPSAERGRPWESLQPDRLAERFVAGRLIDDPRLPDLLLAGANGDEARHLVLLYARAAGHFPTALGDGLTAFVERHAALLAGSAVEAAAQVENPDPLLLALERILEDPAVRRADLERIFDRLPLDSLVLASVGIRLVERLVAVYRTLVASGAGRDEAFLALGLTALAKRLGTVGRLDEALTAATEAVQIRRRLARVAPTVFRDELADGLDVLSLRLRDVGRLGEALDAVAESVRISGELAETDPDRHRPVLAAALANLAIVQGDLGRDEQALETCGRAAAIYRELSSADPAAYQAGLAGVLMNASSYQAAIGRRREALDQLAEAVELYRGLAEARPDAYLPALAGVSTNLSARLSDNGRPEEALAAAVESVQILLLCTQRISGAHRDDLANALNTLANCFGDLGRRREALAASRESVEMYRELAATWPERFHPRLANSLNSYSVQLAESGVADEALSANTEAVAILRELVRKQPEGNLPDLGAALDNLSNRLSDVRRRRASVAASRECVRIRRALAAEAPDAHLPALATSLNNYAAGLANRQRRFKACSVAREATEICRSLAERDPEAFRPDLARSLVNLGMLRGATLRVRRALATNTEAVDIYRELPAAHLDNYAVSLQRQIGYLLLLRRKDQEAQARAELGRVNEQLTAGPE